MRNAKLGNHLNNVIESTNKFSNPRFVTTSRKIFCKSEKIFCHVLLAPAVCHHQRFSRHFAASKMAEFCVSCGSKVNPGDKFCFKCGAKVAEISHATAKVHPNINVLRALLPSHYRNTWRPKRKSVENTSPISQTTKLVLKGKSTMQDPVPNGL